MKRGMQRIIARRAGISESMLSQVLTGKVVPSAAVAAKISAASGGEIAVVDLLYPEGVPKDVLITRKSAG